MPRRWQKSIPSRQASSAARGPSYCQLAEREVVVQDGGGAALTLRERERERPAHVLEPLPLPQRGAGRTPGAERAGRLGQPELRGQLERPLGGCDRLRVGAADDALPRQLRVGVDELGAGRLRLEQRQGLADRLLGARVGKPSSTTASAVSTRPAAMLASCRR